MFGNWDPELVFYIHSVFEPRDPNPKWFLSIEIRLPSVFGSLQSGFWITEYVFKITNSYPECLDKDQDLVQSGFIAMGYRFRTFFCFFFISETQYIYIIYILAINRIQVRNSFKF